jgi:hypothetical protein
MKNVDGGYYLKPELTGGKGRIILAEVIQIKKR